MTEGEVVDIPSNQTDCIEFLGDRLQPGVVIRFPDGACYRYRTPEDNVRIQKEDHGLPFDERRNASWERL